MTSSFCAAINIFFSPLARRFNSLLLEGISFQEMLFYFDPDVSTSGTMARVKLESDERCIFADILIHGVDMKSTSC